MVDYRQWLEARLVLGILLNDHHQNRRVNRMRLFYIEDPTFWTSSWILVTIVHHTRRHYIRCLLFHISVSRNYSPHLWLLRSLDTRDVKFAWYPALTSYLVALKTLGNTDLPFNSLKGAFEKTYDYSPHCLASSELELNVDVWCSMSFPYGLFSYSEYILTYSCCFCYPPIFGRTTDTTTVSGLCESFLGTSFWTFLRLILERTISF